MILKKYYTGIGSRRTPKNILDMMTNIATILEQKGWTLRSGGAGGSDLAFEKGVKHRKDIYIPWDGFNGSDSYKVFDYCEDDVIEKAFEIASKNHPYWATLSDSSRKFMGRNVFQVLGEELNIESKFLICWTPDGCESPETRTDDTGGTGLAISVASKLGIPVFNLKNEDSLNRVKKLLEN